MEDSPFEAHEPAPEEKPQACPLLGLRDDPHTRYNFATVGNYCHRVQPPWAVRVEYQERVCLAGEAYLACPVYRGASRRQTARPEARRRKRWVGWLWPALLLLAALIVLLGYNPLRRMLFPNGGQSPGDNLVGATASPNVLPVPSATDTRPPPTPTLLSTPTLTAVPVSPTLDPAMMTPGPGLRTPFGSQNTYLLHPVADGESLPLIAELYNTTVEVLRALNALNVTVSIQPGEILVVSPDRVELADITPLLPLLLVEDTNINDLAAAYATTPGKLRGDNALGPGDVIPAGRWLVVPYVLVEGLAGQPSITPSPTPNLSFVLAGPLGPDGEYYLHEVIAGESLPYIADLYDSTVEVLAALNALGDDLGVQPGQVLVVAPGWEDPALVAQALTAYLVESDTPLANLAAQFGVTVNDLRQYNQIPGDIVNAGTWLLVPVG